MTILVTGAAGFIGSHTVDLLLAQGHDVIGIDNLRSGRLQNLRTAQRSARFRLVQADVRDAGRVDRIVAESTPRAVIHLAALVGVQESLADPALCHAINVQGTEIVLGAARRHGVERLVFASSAAVYGEPAALPLAENSPCAPLSPYAAAKLTGEELLLERLSAPGPGVLCLRYFNVYGPRQDPSSPYSGVISIFERRLAAREPATIYGDGEQTRDFVFVGDVARVNVLAATRPEAEAGVFNICTGHATSLNRLFAALHRHYQDAPAPNHAPARPGDIRHSRGDPGEARKRLQFSAMMDLDRGLAAFVAQKDG